MNEEHAQRGLMRPIRILFENGDCITTNINGTRAEILNYYVGKQFNLGMEADDMRAAVRVEFLEDQR
mgnify:CR=1 FL=1